MKNNTIIKYKDLTESQKIELIEIVIDCFGHLMTFTKNKDVLKSLFLSGLNPDYTFAYVEESTVVGMLGLGTNSIRPLKFHKDTCVKLFGKVKGSILEKQMNAIFQSKTVKENTDLYIDFLATAKSSRGKGIATKLLEFSFSLSGYTDFYIEVFSKNINAKRLYEKLGFSIIKKNKLSFLLLQGNGYPIKMKRSHT